MKSDIVLGLGTGFLFACMAVVVFTFALAITQGIVTGDYRVIIDINAYGEAWWELGMIVVFGTCGVTTLRYVLRKVWGKTVSKTGVKNAIKENYKNPLFRNRAILK